MRSTVTPAPIQHIRRTLSPKIDVDEVLGASNAQSLANPHRSLVGNRDHRAAAGDARFRGRRFSEGGAFARPFGEGDLE